MDVFPLDKLISVRTSYSERWMEKNVVKKHFHDLTVNKLYLYLCLKTVLYRDSLNIVLIISVEK